MDKMQLTAQEIKRYFKQHVDTFETGVVFHKGTIVGVLKKACGDDDAKYRIVLRQLTGKTSSKLLSEAEWWALYKFVMPIKPEGEKWQSQHGDALPAWCNTLVNFSYTEATYTDENGVERQAQGELFA